MVCSAGGCEPGCFIGNTFYSGGSANPTNVCQSCQPSVGVAAWGNVADGTACGSGKACTAGVCASVTTGCTISGTQYASGAANPANACDTCQPSVSTSAWTPLAEGAGCGAGMVCHASACAAGCYIGGTFEPVGTINPANDCEACTASNATGWSSAPDYTNCGGGYCKAGTCSHPASLPAPRDSHATVTGPDGRVYVIGGYGSSGSSSVVAYDTSANAWSAVASLTTGRAALAGASGSDGRVYAIGGLDSTNVASAVVEAFTPSANTWAAVPNLPTARYGLAAATGKNGRIYAFGGNTSATAGSYVPNTDAFDPTANSWATVTSMPTARASVSAATDPATGNIYVFGGEAAGYLTTVEVYTPSSDTWSAAASMPTARAGAAIAVGPDGKMYAIGGYNGSWLDTVEVFTPSANSWATASAMPTARGSLGAAVGPNGLAYAIGGFSAATGPLANNEAYSTSTTLWYW